MRRNILVSRLSFMMVLGNLWIVGFSYLTLVILGGFTTKDWMQVSFLAAPLTAFFSIRFFDRQSSLPSGGVSGDKLVNTGFANLSTIVVGFCFIFMTAVISASALRFGDVTISNATFAIGIFESILGGYLAIIDKRVS